MLLDWIEDHPGLAGWLQAFGSVGAIAVAIALPILQRRRSEAYARRSLTAPLMRLVSVLQALLDAVSRNYLHAAPQFLEKNLDEIVQDLPSALIDRLEVKLHGPLLRIVGKLRWMRGIASTEIADGNALSKSLLLAGCKDIAVLLLELNKARLMVPPDSVSYLHERASALQEPARVEG